MSSKQSDASFPFDEGAMLDNAERIVGILQRVMQRRLMINTKIEGIPGQFHTAILDIDVKKKSLHLDELSPINGHQFIRKGTVLYLSTLLDGVDIRCPVTIKAVKEDSKGAIYHVNLPERIVYQQRRQNFRVQLHTEHKLYVELFPADHEVIKGEISDISIGGIGAIVFEEYSDFEPHAGEWINCEISLSEETLKTEMEIRFVSRLQHDKGYRIGAKLPKLDQTQQRMMERLVTQLQRELLQKR